MRFPRRQVDVLAFGLVGELAEITEAKARRNASYRRIIEATIDAVQAKGEAGVRLAEVAEAAEVSKTLIYHFFGDREGLIAATEAERYSRLVGPGIARTRAFVETCPSPEAWAEFITNFYRLSSNPSGAERRRGRIQILGSAATRPRLRASVVKANNAAVAELSEAFAVAQERGLMGTEHSPYELAVWIQGLMLNRHLAEMADDPEQEAACNAVNETVVAMLFTKA